MARVSEKLSLSFLIKRKSPHVASGFQTGKLRAQRPLPLELPGVRWEVRLTCGLRLWAGCVLTGHTGRKLEGIQRGLATLGLAGDKTGGVEPPPHGT